MITSHTRFLSITLLLLVMIGVLTACQSADPATTEIAPTDSPVTTTDAETPREEMTEDAESPTATVEPLPDEEATYLMYTMINESGSEQLAEVELMIASGDQRFIPVLLEMMRAAQLGIAPPDMFVASVVGMEALSGESFGGDWAAWVEWYGGTDIIPPPGFVGWKGELLARIDERFADFLRDDVPVRLRPEEILWGGVVVDGIPALDNAPMIPVADADYLDPGDVVFGLEINGDARAYPLRIIDWHEMANDVVGGVPISLAYCTLCGAAIAYDGRASDGNTYTFGSSGFLYRSNKLMYDRQTETLWNHVTGEPVLGPLADQDITLDFFPVVLMTWADWSAQHPDTLVLDIETGFRRTYEPGAAYGNYFASTQTMFPVAQRSDLLPDKSQVFAMRLDGIPKAYPLETLIHEEVVNDTLADTPIVLIARDAPLLVSGVDLRSGPVTYTAGAAVRAYDRGEQTFTAGDDPDTVIDAQGRPWQVTETALLGPNGEEAPRLSGHLAYWFGWFAFFPNTLVYGIEP